MAVGPYPFPGCCEHGDRVHSSKACQITGCQCKARSVTRSSPASQPRAATEDAGVSPSTETAPDPLAARLAGFRLEHEVYQSTTGDRLVVTRVIQPDGEVLTEAAWSP